MITNNVLVHLLQAEKRHTGIDFPQNSRDQQNKWSTNQQVPENIQVLLTRADAEQSV